MNTDERAIGRHQCSLSYPCLILPGIVVLCIRRAARPKTGIGRFPTGSFQRWLPPIVIRSPGSRRHLSNPLHPPERSYRHYCRQKSTSTTEVATSLFMVCRTETDIPISVYMGKGYLGKGPRTTRIRAWRAPGRLLLCFSNHFGLF